MAQRRSEKRTLISISSSSEGGEEEEEQEEDSQEGSESSSEEEEDHKEEGSEEEIVSSSTSCDDEADDDEDYDGGEWSESDDQKEEDESSDDNHVDDDSLSHRVIRLLQDGSDLQEKLNLNECRSYLRRHGLRISGTKAECIQRIKEHWRITDGSGEALYPRSSFNIDCTGDVCKGDVVLFTQRVYEKFDKVTRRGRVLGKRTIAGRIVNESYGAAKQQHTFTVEVLWTKGIKKLPPLFPLLVKGRNLYRLKTFRQRWKNEKERLKVLAEKHKRGTAARLVRAMKNTEARKKKKRASFTNEGRKGLVSGAKRQKHVHYTRPCEVRQTTKLEEGRFPKGCRKNRAKKRHFNCQPQNAPLVGQESFKQATKIRAVAYPGRCNQFSHPNKVQVSSYQSRADPFQDSQHFPLQYPQRGAHHFHFPSCDGVFTSATQILPYFRTSTSSFVMPLPECQQSSHGMHSHHAYFYPTFGLGAGTSNNNAPGLINIHGPSQPFPLRAKQYKYK